MANFLKAFIIFIIWSAFALWFHQTQSNKICGACNVSHTFSTKHSTTNQLEKESIKNNEKLTSKTLKVDSNNKDLSRFFIINSLNEKVETSINFKSFSDSISKLMSFDKELVIVANYLDNEIDAKDEINFGIKRAEYLKTLLVNNNINPNKILTKSKLSDYQYNEANKYYEGIDLIIQNIPDDKIIEIEKNFASRTLHIDFDSTEFIPSKSLQLYTDDVKDYLAKYPTKNVYIEGHTDNLGYYQNNLIVGLQRANILKNYFISKGIESTKIITSSKGESEPIATKGTIEGRAINRRIKVTLK